MGSEWVKEDVCRVSGPRIDAICYPELEQMAIDELLEIQFYQLLN